MDKYQLSTDLPKWLQFTLDTTIVTYMETTYVSDVNGTDGVQTLAIYGPSVIAYITAESWDDLWRQANEAVPAWIENLEYAYAGYDMFIRYGDGSICGTNDADHYGTYDWDMEDWTWEA